jgi:hypothetical protein
LKPGFGPRSRKPDRAGAGELSFPARSDGWNPINESALRDVEAAAIGQQVLVFEAATGRGIDEAFESLAREKVDALFVTGGGSSARGASNSPSWRNATRFRRAIRDALLSKPAG